jgi:hypothetical protein
LSPLPSDDTLSHHYMDMFSAYLVSLKVRSEPGPPTYAFLMHPRAVLSENISVNDDRRCPQDLQWFASKLIH